MVGGRVIDWLRGVSPLRLAAGAGGAALVAVALFAAGTLLRDDGPAPGVLELDPASVGANELALDEQGVLDTDVDGLPDALENVLYGSDPGRWNSSGTPIPDGWLAAHGLSPVDPGVAERPAALPPADALPPGYGNRWPERFTPTVLDLYRFGRPADWDEPTRGPFDSGLDPREWDSNRDGIPDGWLLAHGLDPRNTTLADARLAGPQGLTVREAFEHAADPRTVDSDEDGLSDSDEVAGPANPRAPDGPARFPPTDPARADTSGSGACDGYLVANGLDPTSPTAPYEDPDRDGATTREEYLWSRAEFGAEACAAGAGLDPRDPTSGASALPDGWLIRHGLDPLQDGIDATVTQRSDDDPRPAQGTAAASRELTVADEYRTNRPPTWSEERDGPWWGGTDPASNDTDGDGLGDAWEAAGYRLAVATEPGQPADAPYAATLDPTRADSDGDGLPDREEVVAGTDGRRQDTDFDGLGDGTEAGLGLGLDPRNADTAGDQLRDGERYALLLNRSAAYAADPAYEYPGKTPRAIADLDFVREALAAQRGPDAVSLFSPGGDPDGDKVPNILDPDMDNDTLPNGLEVNPALYAGTEFRGTAPRSATDPINPDTDGEGLLDAWEVRHGLALGDRYSLDPADWDSDGDQTSDADEDPDADSAPWTDLAGNPPTLRSGVYAYSNREEQRFETDPNDDDTDDDALVDGWEVLWSATDRVPPGATRLPNVREPENVTSPASLLFEATYRRYVPNNPVPNLVRDANDPTSPIEASTGPDEEIDDGEGGEITLENVTGTVRFRFHDAQRLRTNPHRLDTDGDGAPDWWEDLRGRALPQTRSLSDDALAGCIDLNPPSPTQVDGAFDPDLDELATADEFAAGSDPLCVDTDMGGMEDGKEVNDFDGLDPNLPGDDASASDTGLDGDGDGVKDADELIGKAYPGLGNRLVKTDPGHPDSDGDGLLDGPNVPPDGVCWTLADGDANRAKALAFLDLGLAYSKDGACYTFLGEQPGDGLRSADPGNADDCRCGIPSGWLAAYSRAIAAPSQQYANHYALGRPAWWDAAVHGPWWGGANPLDNSQDINTLRALRDLDADGLLDRDDAGGPSEDEFPAANPLNAARSIAGLPAGTDPDDEGEPPLLRRLAAQARINPAQYLGPRPAVPHPTTPGTQDQRAATCLQDVRLDGSSGTAPLNKGTPASLTGRLVRCSGGAGVPGVAVQALLGAPRNLFGAAFTGPDGHFAVAVTVDGEEHALDVDPGAQSAFRGNRTGRVAWTPDPASVGSGAMTLLVRSYAVGALGSSAGLRAAETFLSVQVTASASISIEGPDEVLTGQVVPVRIRLLDSGGSPLTGPGGAAIPVDITWNGVRRTETPVAGVVEVELAAVPPADAGQVLLEASAKPPNLPPVHADKTITARAPGSLTLDPLGSADAGQPVEARGRVWRSTGIGSQAAVQGAEVLVNLTRDGKILAQASAASGNDGTFSARIDLPPTLVPGAHKVQVTVRPSEKATGAQAEQALQVRSLPSFHDVSAGHLTAGARHNVTAKLLDPGNRPVADAQVQVRLGDLQATVRTDAKGALKASFDRPLPPGTALQELRFAGDAQRAPATHRAERPVASATALTLPDGVVPRGGEAAVPLHLADADGRPVAGATLGVRWGSEPARFLVTDGAGDATLLRPGSPDDPLGAALVRAWYAGSPGAGLANSTASAVWTLRALAALQLPDLPVEAGGPVTFGRLVDAGTLEPLPGRAVTVRLSDGARLASTTDAAGRFPMLRPVPREADPAALRADAEFPGDAGYPPARASAPLSIRSPTSVDARPPAILVAGQPAVLAVDLLDARGLPARGGALTALAPGGPVGSATVDGSPVRITVTLPDNASAGATALEFRYSGSGTHGPSSGRADVEAVAKAVLLTSAEPAGVGGTALLRVQLLVAGQPAPGQSVTIQLEGVPEGIAATTDADGTATIEVPQVSPTLTFLARYAGADGASPAAAAGSLVAVRPAGLLERQAYLLPWLVAAAAVALGAGALYAWRASRHPLSAAFHRARRIVAARGEPERQILLAYQALEDAAIAAALLTEPARTPRTLQEALLPALPAAAHASLDRLIGLFEEARYGQAALGDAHRDAALDALRGVQRALARHGRARGEAPAGVSA